MSGCIPALIQIPVFYALFMFFPTAFDLRRKSFLWADDLSSYDNILDLPFRIWLYGDHVSLFPILAGIAIFFYMKMTTGQNMASQQPAQEGMPDMAKMMKAATEMQGKMAQMQEDMHNIIVTGEAGAGLVKASCTAKGDLTGLDIDKSIFSGDDKEVVEDLILAAIKDAQQKAAERAKDEMGKMTEGLGLPPGMNLPF